MTRVEVEELHKQTEGKEMFAVFSKGEKYNSFLSSLLSICVSEIVSNVNAFFIIAITLLSSTSILYLERRIFRTEQGVECSDLSIVPTAPIQ